MGPECAAHTTHNVRPFCTLVRQSKISLYNQADLMGSLFKIRFAHLQPKWSSSKTVVTTGKLRDLIGQPLQYYGQPT